MFIFFDFEPLYSTQGMPNASDVVPKGVSSFGPKSSPYLSLVHPTSDEGGDSPPE